MKDAPVIVILRKQYRDSTAEVLLLKRHSDHPLFPNEWCLPGGKREIGDSYFIVGNENDREVITYSESNEEAVYRECHEELGAKIHVFKDTHITMIDDHYQMKVYLAISKVKITKEFPNREHVAYAWFDINELPEKTSSVTRDLLENYKF